MATAGGSRSPTAIVFDLLRPWGLATAGFLFAVTQSPSTLANLGYLVLALSLSGILFTVVGGYCFNDFWDRDIDSVVHPKRVIPSGRIEHSVVVVVALVAFILAIGSFTAVGGVGLIIGVILIASVLAYSPIKSFSGLSGNILMALLPLLIIVYGYSVSERIAHGASFAFLGSAVFFAILSQEIERDIEDMDGERGYRKTLPMQLGVEWSEKLVAFLFLAALVSMVGFLVSDGRQIATALSVPAILLGIVVVQALWRRVHDPTTNVRIMKVVMTISVVLMALVRV